MREVTGGVWRIQPIRRHSGVILMKSENRLSGGYLTGTIAILALFAACIPQGYVHPGAPAVPIVPAEKAAATRSPAETLIVPMAEAQASGLNPVRLELGFGPDGDGTRLLVDFLTQARSRGARYASDIAFYFVTEQEGTRTECRIDIIPYDEVKQVQVPGRTENVGTMVPVSRSVTELQYRCHPATKMVTVPETHMETRCRMVSKPVTRTVTTYTTQYDYFTKSSRSVPQTRTVTDYRMQNECRPESVTRMVTKTQMTNECGMESVTRMVTRYEFQYQLRFVPPHLETVTTARLRETEPVCRDLTEDEEARGSRLEGSIYGAAH